MKGAPCGRCDERRVGCHAECEKYLTWAAERRKALEADHRKRIAERYAHDRNILLSVSKLKKRLRGRKG